MTRSITFYFVIPTLYIREVRHLRVYIGKGGREFVLARARRGSSKLRVYLDTPTEVFVTKEHAR